jgi:hypothetical protein
MIYTMFTAVHCVHLSTSGMSGIAIAPPHANKGIRALTRFMNEQHGLQDATQYCCTLKIFFCNHWMSATSKMMKRGTHAPAVVQYRSHALSGSKNRVVAAPRSYYWRGLMLIFV